MYPLHCENLDLFYWIVPKLIKYRYGYITNTKIKFVIIVDSTNMALRDNEIRSVSITD